MITKFPLFCSWGKLWEINFLLSISIAFPPFNYSIYYMDRLFPTRKEVFIFDCRVSLKNLG